MRLLEPSDLDPLLDSEVKEVNMVMNLPTVATAALLRQHEWNKERLFDKYYSDSSKVVTDAGVDLWKEDAGKGEEKDSGSAISSGRVQLPVADPDSETECQICIEDFKSDEVVAAPCGHFFCKGCYGDYLTQKALDGPDVVFTKCPVRQRIGSVPVRFPSM